MNNNETKYSNMKTYIKPYIKVKNIQLQSAMLAGSDPKVYNEYGYGSGQLGTGRRGTWGDLWSNEEED